MRNEGIVSKTSQIDESQLGVVHSSSDIEILTVASWFERVKQGCGYPLKDALFWNLLVRDGQSLKNMQPDEIQMDERFEKIHERVIKMDMKNHNETCVEVMQILEHKN